MSVKSKAKKHKAFAAAVKKAKGKSPIPQPIDPRDGPTKQFQAKHETIARGHSCGRRIYSKLERLLRMGVIQPDESEAGRRFKHDCEKGDMPHGRSCLDISAGGGGDGHPSMERLDAARRFMDAKQALNDTVGLPRSEFIKPAAMLTLFCVNDTSYPKIAERAWISEDKVRSWIGQYLKVLASYYAEIDRKSGKSTTSYSRDQALSRFDPKDDV